MIQPYSSVHHIPIPSWHKCTNITLTSHDTLNFLLSFWHGLTHHMYHTQCINSGNSVSMWHIITHQFIHFINILTRARHKRNKLIFIFRIVFNIPWWLLSLNQIIFGLHIQTSMYGVCNTYIKCLLLHIIEFHHLT